MHTQRGKVQEARKDNSPEAGGVDNVTTVDLEAEQTLYTRASGRSIEERANQKTIR